MNEAGWEIATHGYKWIDYRDTPNEIEAPAHRRGGPHPHRDRRRAPARLLPGPLLDQHDPLGMEEGGFLYCADSYADDLPYWIEGPRGPAAHRALHARHQRHAVRHAAGLQLRRPVLRLSEGRVRRALRRGRDRAEDAVDRPCTAGSSAGPARAASLARFLDYVRGHDKVWVATRLDIARHWIAKHPPPGGWKPSQLTRTLFVERFGGVYEHSRWVAEAALRSRARRGSRHGRRAWRQRMARRGGGGRRRAEARADRRPSRSRRPARARQDADRRIRRASRRAPALTN